MRAVETNLLCAGCGAEVSATAPPLQHFVCKKADSDDRDHVLARHLDLSALSWPDGLSSNPFLAYREFFSSYQWARSQGLSDATFVELVEDLDRAVADVDGRGFVTTPFLPEPELASALGLREVWIKDETGNVSGSHKARHLMGVALFLHAYETLGLTPELPRDGAQKSPSGPRLAIASCGNAALAAAVVARAMQRPLDVFIPPHAEEPVVARLSRLGAGLIRCPRQADEKGDPCYLRFLQAIAAGALPFGCQGTDNGLTIEGGQTLAYEMVSTLRSHPHEELDHLVVQVGGGALASACCAAFEEAVALGAIKRLPRIHTVQTESASPLRRAFERLEHRLGDNRDPAAIAAALDHARSHRSLYMWPWETEPFSVAHGILDDETYDWLVPVRSMLATGGSAITVSEEDLRAANQMARLKTDIPADHTGTSGLAGVVKLVARGAINSDETVAVLFTGHDRSG